MLSVSNSKSYTSIAIRKAKPEETGLLSDLAFRAKSHWGYDNDFMEKCRKELTLCPEDLNEKPTFVLEFKSAIRGFYTLCSISKTKVDLDMLFVDPEFIRQGYGKALILHAKETAQMMGFLRMTVQSDPNAVGFYKRTGGKIIGTLPSLSIVGRSLPLLEMEF